MVDRLFEDRVTLPRDDRHALSGHQPYTGRRPFGRPADRPGHDRPRLVVLVASDAAHFFANIGRELAYPRRLQPR